MKPRKIVQVTLLNESDSWNARLYAVADDGSLWISEHWTAGTFSPWQQLPPLPPIEEPEGEEIPSDEARRVTLNSHHEFWRWAIQHPRKRRAVTPEGISVWLKGCGVGHNFIIGGKLPYPHLLTFPMVACHDEHGNIKPRKKRKDDDEEGGSFVTINVEEMRERLNRKEQP